MNLDAFLAIEKKYNLVTDTIDGFAYWVFFRWDLLEEIRTHTGYGIAHMNPPFSRRRRLKYRLGMIKNAILFGNRFWGKCDVLVLNDGRRVWTDSYYESTYTDQIVAMYPDSVVLERPYLQSHFRPVMTKHLIYTDYLEIKAMLYYNWCQKFDFSKMKKIREEIYCRIQKPIEEICNAYNFEHDMSGILEKMLCGYYVYKIKRKEYIRVLDKYHPKLILEVCGYNLDCMTVNELADERNIPSVELQHGFTGAGHISYNYPEGVSVKQFPQYFFVFSDFWAKSARYPIPEANIKVVGFPHLERKALAVKARVKKGKIKKVIFISQGPIGAALSKIAVDLDKLIDKEKYEIIYKLHPGEYEGWKERYRELAASKIFVADNSQYDLYELLAESTFQVGACGSTATFEGLYFSLKTFVLREKAASELELLCEKKIAQFFDTAEELYRYIVQNENMHNEKIVFWKENALENMKYEIDNILEARC